jgi:hypothetical protein
MGVDTRGGSDVKSVLDDLRSNPSLQYAMPWLLDEKRLKSSVEALCGLLSLEDNKRISASEFREHAFTFLNEVLGQSSLAFLYSLHGFAQKEGLSALSLFRFSPPLGAVKEPVSSLEIEISSRVMKECLTDFLNESGGGAKIVNLNANQDGEGCTLSPFEFLIEGVLGADLAKLEHASFQSRFRKNLEALGRRTADLKVKAICNNWKEYSVELKTSWVAFETQTEKSAVFVLRALLARFRAQLGLYVSISNVYGDLDNSAKLGNETRDVRNALDGLNQSSFAAGLLPDPGMVPVAKKEASGLSDQFNKIKEPQLYLLRFERYLSQLIERLETLDESVRIPSKHIKIFKKRLSVLLALDQTKPNEVNSLIQIVNELMKAYDSSENIVTLKLGSKVLTDPSSLPEEAFKRDLAFIQRALKVKTEPGLPTKKKLTALALASGQYVSQAGFKMPEGFELLVIKGFDGSLVSETNLGYKINLEDGREMDLMHEKSGRLAFFVEIDRDASRKDFVSNALLTLKALSVNRWYVKN